MKLILLIAHVLCVTLIFGQQNLIPNGSFEKHNADVFDKLKNALATGNVERMVMSHFGTDYTSPSLFDCWRFESPSGNTGNNDGIGLLFGIMPNLYTTYGGTEVNNLPKAEVFLDADSTDVRIFSAETATGVGVRLEPSVANGLAGFDCSPPNTMWGSNVFAPDGSNYILLCDFKHNGLGGAQGAEASKPMISAKLEEPLIKGKKYTFVITRAQINELGTFADNGDFVPKDAKLEIHVGSDDFTPKQLISEETFSHNGWETKTYEFEANKAHTHIRIKMNPLGSSSVGSAKIAACFIDNLKLYESCETPQNQCNNRQYRCDMLDVDLKKTEVGDPLAFPDFNQNDKDFLKTIKATGLENVKRLEMKIYTSSGSLIRVIDKWYPPSQYFWDGKYDGGTDAPAGSYKAVINAVSNDCFHNSFPVEKNFNLKRKYTVFGGLQISTSFFPTQFQGAIGVPVVKGLEDVHWMNVKIYTVGGALIHNENYNNPPNELVLSTSWGNSVAIFPPSGGTYLVELTMSNNCQSDNLQNNWDHFFSGTVYIGQIDSYDLVDPTVFDWSANSKPDATCPFNFDYQDNYLEPRNCCEGNLYIDNVDILNDFDVNIQQDIFFGENVSFGNNSNNIFFAGDDIEGEPGLTIPLGANVELVAGVYNCIACIEQAEIQNAGDQVGFYGFEESQELENERDSLRNVKDVSGVYPNPTQSGTVVSVRLLELSISESYTIVLLDGFGKKYKVDILQQSGNSLTIQLPNKLSSGIYYLKVDTGTMLQSFRLQITK